MTTSTEKDFDAIAQALDELEDGSPIAGASLIVARRVRELGGSEQAAALAQALTRLVVRATNNGNE